MPRQYKKKTNRFPISEEIMKIAMKEVLTKKNTLRGAAEKHNLNRSTLCKRLKILKRNNKSIVDLIENKNNDSGQSSDEDALVTLKLTDRGKYKHSQIFTDSEEQQLKEYLLRSSKIHYGLTYIQTRKLAFEYAEQLKKKIVGIWEIHNLAGKDWMLAFMKRHPELSLRSPESTSMARATAFNKTNVAEFFKNYLDVMNRFQFTSDRIYNIDESKITTVMPTPKVNYLLRYFQQLTIILI